MAYSYNLPNGTLGFDDSIAGIATVVPAFIPLTLLFVYCVIFIGGAISQKNRQGTSDLPMWSTIAGIATLMVALPMSLISGVIEPYLLTITVLIPILSGVWLFLDNHRNEV